MQLREQSKRQFEAYRFEREDADHENNPYLKRRWESIYYRAHDIQKKRGTDRSDLMYRKYNQEEVSTEIVAGVHYTPTELDEKASQLLRDDSKAELCRECGVAGEETGSTESVPEGLVDGEGNELTLAFEEYECPNGHTWYPGEGQLKGIGGDNPILFEEHFQSRKRREIYTAQGTPDPSIVSGMYNRTHPQGRKVNSPEQRKKNGASFFR